MSDQIKAEIVRLMREEFDPRPPNYGGHSWDDDAEAVADRIMSLFRAAPAPAPGGVEALPYQVLFNAIAAATDIASGGLAVSISVEKFRAALTTDASPSGEAAAYHQAWVEDWSEKIAASSVKERRHDD